MKMKMFFRLHCRPREEDTFKCHWGIGTVRFNLSAVYSFFCGRSFARFLFRLVVRFFDNFNGTRLKKTYDNIGMAGSCSMQLCRYW